MRNPAKFFPKLMPGCRADSGRHQQLSGGVVGKTIENPCCSTWKQGTGASTSGSPRKSTGRSSTHISDINLPYSDISREYLLREGIAPDRIIKTGSPMSEVPAYYREKIDQSDALTRLGLV